MALVLVVAFTGVLLQYFGAFSGSPAERAPAPNTPFGRLLFRYLPLLFVNAALLFYCCRVARTENALPALLGERWRTAQRAFADLGLALISAFLILVVERFTAPARALGRNAALAALLPSTGAERLTWIAVALSVGFCEEVVYRGYLQTQLSAFARSRTLGVLLQAALFGLAHLEQGLPAALRIASYGLLLGTLAQLRRSLLPGIACHIGLDLASGLLR